MSDPLVEPTEVQTESHQESGRRLSRDVSASEVAPALPGYELHRLLGTGSFGSVWAGTQTRTGLSVGVKVLHDTQKLQVASMKNEVARLRELVEHPNIVSLLDADLGHDPAYFVVP